LKQLRISGEIFSDETTINAYSFDMSHYHVKPKMIAVPANEEDIARIVAYSKEERVPITPRGAGSNQSGSAVGRGIIVLFSKMTGIMKRDGRKVMVQPGIVHQRLDQELNVDGLRIPYDPTSRSFCTIGGNVATKAGGIRSLKYGTVDSALRSLSFMDVSHGLIHTSEGLPQDMEKTIVHLKNQLRTDKETTEIVRARENLKSSSGYNLRSFYDYEEPREIVTHLMAGSVGTLGIFTQIELEAIPMLKDANLYVLFFHSLIDAVKDIPKLKSFKPSAIEVMDSNGVELLRDVSENKVPHNCQALLFVEFDSGLDEADKLIRDYCLERSTKFWFEPDPHTQAQLWKVRESMLLWIMNSRETAEKKFPPFADDLSVPVERLPEFLVAVQQILKSVGTTAVIYGHAGEGNVHIRPMITLENWEQKLRKLSSLMFDAALREGGTITGEHGLGRNRSKYLQDEWGNRIFRYFKKVKEIFDPMEILNPDIVFTSQDLTKNLGLQVS